MGDLRLNFGLPAAIDSGESIFFYNLKANNHENSTNFEIAIRHVY
jgi:hypothetical protein